MIPTPSFRLSCLVIIVYILLFTWSISLTATAQQQTTTTTTAGGGTGAATSSVTPSPPLTLQEQEQQTRLQNVIASTTLYLEETEKQISGVVFTPRWSQPVWVNANSVAVLTAYCLPGEFADSGQEILGGFGLEVLESYGVALPQGFMVWMAVVGNEDIQNRRLPTALGVICASDLNRPETRVLSPQKQQEINNINQQFVNIQNTQINDIDNVINVINSVTTNTNTPTPPTQNATAGGGTTLLPSSGDIIPPTLTVPANFTLDSTSAEGTVPFYVLTAQDNVDGTARLENSSSITQDDVGGNIAISCDPPSNSVFPIGATTVQCSATDAAGNTGTASFVVTVRAPSAPSSSPAGSTADTTSPTLIGPEDVLFEPTSQQSGRVTYTITAEDNVDGTAKLEADGITITQDNVGGNIAISCTPPSGSELLSGETILTCVATDQAGNEFRDSLPATVTPGSDGGTGGGPSGIPALTGSDAPLGEDADSGTGLDEDEEEGDEGETSEAEGEPSPPAEEDGEGDEGDTSGD